MGACSNLSGPTPCNGKYIMYENLGGSQDITEDKAAGERLAVAEHDGFVPAHHCQHETRCA